MERPPAFWTARKALAALVLFIGRRYYLRPISSGTREAQLERPIGLLERPLTQGKALGNTPPLIDRLHTYCRLNVVLMHTLRKIHLQTACGLFLIPKRLNPFFKIHFGTANAVLNELPAIPEGAVCRAENVAYIGDIQSQN